MKRLFACALLLFAAAPSLAADANGYTAKYEKQIGTPPACSTVISSVNDPNWSKLNDPAYRVICIAPGDYRSKGLITLTASGTAGNERWLRYDNGAANPGSVAHPVKQSNRAILSRVEFRNANYWVLNRLTVDGDMGNITLVRFHYDQSSNYNVLDSLLVQNGAGANNRLVWFRANNSFNTLQNSVVRSSVIGVNQDNDCVEVDNSHNNRIVNNEIYNCMKTIAMKGNAGGGAQGTIVENNDIYLTNAYYTDCAGTLNQNGMCAASKSGISFKTGGTASKPVLVFQNRVWGFRYTDRSICCLSTGAGAAMVLSTDDYGYADHVLIKNNIIMDTEQGIGQPRDGTRNNSIIGNIFYDIRTINTNSPLEPFSLNVRKGTNTEWYANSLIKVEKWINLEGSATDNDVRCNVVIDSPDTGTQAPGAGTVVDNNVFYNSRVYTTAVGSSTNIVLANATEAAANSYCFTRKRITSSENFCIPNARPTTASPHYAKCPTDTGNRPGIGINDQ